ncbi:MAG: NYN domain-containing protein, partial [bacterium]|nr:NYN domain-containing protein [bacterium]
EATTGGVGILLDAENIVIQARNDEACRLKDLAVLDLVIHQALSGIAEGSRLVRADAAVSVPPSGNCQGSQKRYGIPEDTVRIVQHLIDSRFTSVALVQQGADSADWQIYRSGLAMVADTRIDKVILCTCDGGEPFVKLVGCLLAAGKSVELIAYDKIARSMKDFPASHSLIFPAAHLASADLIEKEATVTADVKVNPTAPTAETLETIDGPHKKRTYVFQKILRKIANGSDDYNDPSHKKLRSEVWFLVRKMEKCQGAYFSQGQLIDLATRGLAKEISEEETKEIVFDLCEHSDLFSADNRFRINPKSALLKKLKPI